MNWHVLRTTLTLWRITRPIQLLRFRNSKLFDLPSGHPQAHPGKVKRDPALAHSVDPVLAENAHPFKDPPLMMNNPFGCTIKKTG